MHYEAGTWTEIFPMFDNVLTRSKGSTRNFGPAQLILLDDIDDELNEFGVGDSINTDGEDFTTWLQVGEVSNEDAVESESAEDEGTLAAWDDIEVCDCCGWTGSGTCTRIATSEAAGAKALDESSTSILVTVAFNLGTEEFWQKEGIAELITEERHEYSRFTARWFKDLHIQHLGESRDAFSY